jgi:hypothetical protein
MLPIALGVFEKTISSSSGDFLRLFWGHCTGFWVLNANALLRFYIRYGGWYRIIIIISHFLIPFRVGNFRVRLRFD